MGWANTGAAREMKAQMLNIASIPLVRHLANENYIGPDGNWTRDNAPFTTYPCVPQEAINLAVQIQEKLRGDWHGVGGIKDGVNLGLAARIIEAYHDIHKPRIISMAWWRRVLRRLDS